MNTEMPRVIQVGGEPVQGFKSIPCRTLGQAQGIEESLHSKYGYLPSGLPRFVVLIRKEGAYSIDFTSPLPMSHPKIKKLQKSLLKKLST